MKIKFYRLDSLRHNLFEPLFSKTLIHGFGQIKTSLKNNKDATMITAIFTNSESHSPRSFFINEIPIEALSLLRRGDIYNKAGRYLGQDQSRTLNKEITFLYSNRNKPRPISEYISSTVKAKYKLLSDEFCNQWAIKLDAIEQNGSLLNVVVPCTTIASFYLPHSCLLRAALSGQGDGAESLLINKKLTAQGRELLNEGVEYIHLSKGMYDVVAPYVARIFLSEVAKRAFNSIHGHSRLIPLPSTSKYSLYCTPFAEGNLKWNVLGKMIKDPAHGELFLVSQITSCNAPFPFTELIFGRENDNRGNSDENTEEKLIGTKKNMRKTPSDQNDSSEDEGSKENISSENDIDNDGIADSEIETIHIIADNNDTINSQLANIKVRKIEKITIKTKVKHIFRGNAIISGASFLSSPHSTNNLEHQDLLAKIDAGRMSTTHGKNIQDHKDSNFGIEAPNLARIYTLLQDIQLTNLVITFRDIKGDCTSYQKLSKYENVVPSNLRDLEKTSSWVMLRKKLKDNEDEVLGDQVLRCRRFIIAEFNHGGVYSYLIEFQNAKEDNIAGLFFSNYTERLTPKKLLIEIELNITGKRRYWRKSSNMKFTRKLSHTMSANKNDIESFSEDDGTTYLNHITNCLKKVKEFQTKNNT